MATDNEMITTKTVVELGEKTTPVDADLFMAGDAGTAALKKFKWSSLLSAIKAKIAAWTFDALTTTNKTLPGAVNELNSNFASETEYTEFSPEIDASHGTLKRSQCYKYGKNVTVTAFIENVNTSETTELQIGTIPKEFCPNQILHFPATGTGSGIHFWAIEPGGKISARHGNGTVLILHGSYHIE